MRVCVSGYIAGEALTVQEEDLSGAREFSWGNTILLEKVKLSLSANELMDLPRKFADLALPRVLEVVGALDERGVIADSIDFADDAQEGFEVERVIKEIPGQLPAKTIRDGILIRPGPDAQ